jgi:hypothetical protein
MNLSRRQTGLPSYYSSHRTGPNPTARSKSGSKHHVLTDAQGIPLNFLLRNEANCLSSTERSTKRYQIAATLSPDS